MSRGARSFLTFYKHSFFESFDLGWRLEFTSALCPVDGSAGFRHGRKPHRMGCIARIRYEAV